MFYLNPGGGSIANITHSRHQKQEENAMGDGAEGEAKAERVVVGGGLNGWAAYKDLKSKFCLFYFCR